MQLPIDRMVEVVINHPDAEIGEFLLIKIIPAQWPRNIGGAAGLLAQVHHKISLYAGAGHLATVLQRRIYMQMV